MNEPCPAGLPDWADPRNATPLPLELRVEDYLLLDRAGAFADYARTELIDGEIVYTNAQHRPHVQARMALYDALRDALRDSGIALTPFVEGSIAVPPNDIPEPDILLTSELDGDGLVPIASVALVVEVSDTSLNFDLGKKRERYATAGVPEYWVADVGARVIHQFRAPADGAFTERREVPFGAALGAATVPRLAISTDGLG